MWGGLSKVGDDNDVEAKSDRMNQHLIYLRSYQEIAFSCKSSFHI